MTPSASSGDAANARQLSRRRGVRVAQVRLLYQNANLGVAVALFATAALGCVQWAFVPHKNILAWCVYMYAVSVARYLLARRYVRNTPSGPETDWWCRAFAIGAGLAGTGWGAAGILLYPEADLAHQILLVFVLRGMILGAASLLASRPEAFLAFIVPTGFAPALRLRMKPTLRWASWPAFSRLLRWSPLSEFI